VRNNILSEITFHALFRQLIAADRAGDYTRALELAEQAANCFPERAKQTLHWRICLTAGSGKQEQSLLLLREALNQGYCYPPSALEQEPALASLRDLAAFRELLEVNNERFAEIQAHARPELLVVPSVQQATAYPLLIALHGNGSNARDTSKYWAEITAQGWFLALPQSSRLIGPGEYTWDNREQGSREVREHLAALIRTHAIDRERVVLGGFSMGGSLAIWLALHRSIKTCGFIALGPSLTAAELEALTTLFDTCAPAGLRGYIIVGEEDTWSLESSRKIVELLQAHDVSCRLEILPGLDHSYPPHFAEHVTKGLGFVTQS
jgi:predicted esterase